MLNQSQTKAAKDQTALFRWLASDTAGRKLRAKLASRSLIEFCKYTYRGYKAEPVHVLIASYLDKMLRGEIKRLQVYTPPQLGKSLLVSVNFPAYWLGQRPDDPIILASYNSDLAYAKSRLARNVVESIEFQEVFPGVRTHPESRAVDLWQLKAPHRGQLRAAGVGAGLTGHPSLLGCLDDPLESWEQAMSSLMRDKIWDWYRSTFRTRIWENGSIVLVMTRWNPDDLAGMLLQEQADQWTVLRLPALAETQEERDWAARKLGLPEGQPDPLGREPGESVCPLRFSAETFLEIKKDVGATVWAAMYQGVPTPLEGTLFKRDWFKDKIIVGGGPPEARRARYWDMAATKGQTSKGPRTAGVLLAVDRGGKIYIEDVVSGRWAPARRNEIIKACAERDAAQFNNSGRLWFEQEPGSSGTEVAVDLITFLAGFAAYRDRVTGSKDVRMEPLRTQADIGNVYIKKAAWNNDFLEELCSVPNGLYRDQADAAAGAYNRLTRGAVTVGKIEE